jgi:hypothetical protein
VAEDVEAEHSTEDQKDGHLVRQLDAEQRFSSVVPSCTKLRRRRKLERASIGDRRNSTSVSEKYRPILSKKAPNLVKKNRPKLCLTMYINKDFCPTGLLIIN